MILYLAGPMRGYKDLNFSAFDDAASKLRAVGYDVMSPVEMDRREGVDAEFVSVLAPEQKDKLRKDFLLRDVAAICSCDGVALLPGWSNSKGAIAENAFAEACGITSKLIDLWLTDKDGG